MGSDEGTKASVSKKNSSKSSGFFGLIEIVFDVDCIDVFVVEEDGDGIDDGEVAVVKGADPAVNRVEGASKRKLCVP